LKIDKTILSAPLNFAWEATMKDAESRGQSRDLSPVARISRRAFLGGSALAGLSLVTSLGARRASAFEPSPPPFTLGVASGDPTYNSVVLWTRLATELLHGGGMGTEPVRVHWEVATDDQMHHVVRRGSIVAEASSGHSVHVRVRGLAPDRWYWYRFRVGGELSLIGRTRTFPAPWSHPGLLRFAFASCQHFEDGFYPAWAHLAEEDIDCVVHLGDYIYEDGARTEGAVRRHVPVSETMTLDDYRVRYAQYKGDPNLQAAHARFPFIVTWDDHEVEDNYAADVSVDNGDADPTNDVSPAQFLARRAHAYQAFFEHMPLRPRFHPSGPDLRLFRRFRWGRLAEFSVLDTRQYRSGQPCGGDMDRLPPAGDDLVIACGEELDPDATMMGAGQEAWLLEGLRRSRARWNIVAQQVMMAAVDYGPGIAQLDPRVAGLAVRNVDAWDGYVAVRNRLLGTVGAEGIRNLVVITGDTHASWVADLKTDYADAASPVVGTEFVGTSISSGISPLLIPVVQGSLPDPANAHLKFFDGHFRGYVRCTVKPGLWLSDYRVVDTVTEPSSPVHTLASFVVEDGSPGALPA
jgi:alkaline phosphatase D